MSFRWAFQIVLLFASPIKLPFLILIGLNMGSVTLQVSYNVGVRHFTIHTYPLKKAPRGLSCFMKIGRSRKDIRFLASSSEEAHQWVSGFADQQCFVNCLPHPLKQASDMVASDFSSDSHVKCKSPPKVLVILNPRSGRGRSSKVFHGMVEPIFKVYWHFWIILYVYLTV